jgi:fatty acid desaturase
MTQAGNWKDYRLTESNSREAELKGLVSAQWFKCNVARADMKRMMQRSDKEGLLQMGLWLGLLAASGAAAFLAWGTLWCIPALIVYGMLYAASDHCAHELSHGTPFKTAWLNNIFYQLASFMTLHEAVYWRWSHARHHTDTIIVGRDREIAFPRPARMWTIVLDAFFLPGGIVEILRTVRHATGKLSAESRSFIPESEIKKVVFNSRIYVLIFVALIAWCIAAQSILPVLFIVLPRFYGAWLPHLFNFTQHTGLAEDVLDHRLNTRTIYLNPVFEFLYMKMNYHLEHHMFPMVPFHALPQLHAAIKEQSPPAYPSLWAAYGDIIPALLLQRRNPGHTIEPRVPAGGVALAS